MFQREVVLTKVYTVGIHGCGNVHMVVHDEKNIGPPQQAGKPERGFVYDLPGADLVAILEESHPCGQCCFRGGLGGNLQELRIKDQTEPPDIISAGYNTAP